MTNDGLYLYEYVLTLIQYVRLIRRSTYFTKGTDSTEHTYVPMMVGFSSSFCLSLVVFFSSKKRGKEEKK